MATMRQCRSCGKTRPSALFSSPISACSICRHETALANDPGSEVFKAQLRNACEVAGEPYEKAVERAMERCTVRQRKPSAPKTQKAQPVGWAELEQQQAALGDMRLHVAALENQIAELTEELSKERDAHVQVQRNLTAANKARKKAQVLSKRLEVMVDEKDQAITNLQNGILRVTQEVRELRAAGENVEVD